MGVCRQMYGYRRTAKPVPVPFWAWVTLAVTPLALIPLTLLGQTWVIYALILWLFLNQRRVFGSRR